MPVRFVAASLIAITLYAAETVPVGPAAVVHEWGTFTSVAGLDGAPVNWFALGGPSKLPCFVHRPQFLTKNSYFTTVRMETPVIYFYAHDPTTMSVKVDFPGGALTEWYPDARHDTPSSLEWRNVQVLPSADPALPTGGEGNHYYAARATDAKPLRVGKETEKLLFYRGVGDFPVPVQPVFTSGGRIEVRNLSRNPVAAAFVFENRDGKWGYRALHNLRGSAVVEPPKLAADSGRLRADLLQELVRAGLYEKEARAMLETWRDSWFEPGLRVVYLVPRADVDAVLPLHIAPAPPEIARVFVGRVEMMSPAMAAEVEAGIAARDRAALAKYGRFLQAFWDSIRRSRGLMANQILGELAPVESGGCAN